MGGASRNEIQHFMGLTPSGRATREAPARLTWSKFLESTIENFMLGVGSMK